MNNDRLFEVLDKISEDVSDLKVTVAKQEENIKEHIRRTELAEENLDLIRKEMQPLKEHVIAINGVLKSIGIISIIIGSGVSFFQLIQKVVDFIK